MGKRPFYTHPQGAPPPECPPNDPRREVGRYSNSFDLLFRGLELTTGGQRLHRPSDYAAAMQRTGTDPTSSPATSTPSPTACLRTAALPSVWRGGWPG